MSDGWRIVKAERKYCPTHLRTINSVAQECKYLATNVGFCEEDIISFFDYCEDYGFPQFYVVDDNDEAVGWCDIVTREGSGRRVGYIGVGLLPEYRERGIGTQLMQRAMDEAYRRGFRIIKLECRESNKRALHVYKKKLGFRVERLKKRIMELDGERIPLICMKKRLKKSAEAK